VRDTAFLLPRVADRYDAFADFAPLRICLQHIGKYNMEEGRNIE
jgi:hypothetical protein